MRSRLRASLKWTETPASRQTTFWWWLSHGVLALIAAWPLSLITTRVARSLPGGDARLFEPGGAWLVEAFRLHTEPLTGALLAGGLLLALGGCLKLVPLTALFVSLNRECLRPSEPWARISRHLLSFGLLSGMIGFGHVLLGVFWLLTANFVSETFQYALNEQHLDVLNALWLLVWLVPHAVLQVLLDLARTRCAKFEERAWPSLLAAVESWLRSPLRWLGRWFFWWVLGALGPIGAWWLSLALDVSQPGGSALGLLTLGHQAAIAWLVLARVGWLGTCSESGPTPSSDETPEAIGDL
ncbi:MAG: hypothetical protein RJA70_2275 [Pseudomonadota bacterium]|jgi:hypothetical protein